MANQVVQRYAFSHYGHLILVDEPIFDKSENCYLSNLRSDYPFTIRDDKLPNERSVCLLKMDHLGCIAVGKDFKIIPDKTTLRNDCVKNIDSYFEAWKRRAEQIVIYETASNLARITRFEHFFEPVDSILGALWKYHFVDDAEVKAEPIVERRNKLQLYLDLLEGLEIVRRVCKGYEEGPLSLFLRGEKQIDNQSCERETYRNRVITALIRDRYTTLRDVFKLTIFERTIHFDNCIYLPELEADKPVYRTVETMQTDYKKFYGQRVSKMNAELILDQLQEVDAIEQDGKHYFGNGNLRRDMILMKEKTPLISREFCLK